jgi:nitrate reductase gamma subunit
MTHHEPSSMLVTAEIVHWIALVVMGIVYTTRLWWLFRFKGGKDKSAPGAPHRTNAIKGAWYSLGNVAMPWGMESTRRPRGFVFYLSFTLFHLGVVAGITLAFVSTLAPQIMARQDVATVSGALLVSAFLIAVYRVLRRLLRPVMRLISTPDDYFSLMMLTVWFGLGAATQGSIAGVEVLQHEILLVAYLYLTSFFLLYVPFSKISHYLYYPFTRWWIGKALGHRGSLPMVRG